MQINPILWLYALRLCQVAGGFSILFAPIMFLDAEYTLYAPLMIGLGALLLVLPYSDAFGRVMNAGYEGSKKRNGGGDDGETRQKKRQRQRQERKNPNGLTWKRVHEWTRFGTPHQSSNVCQSAALAYYQQLQRSLLPGMVRLKRNPKLRGDKTTVPPTATTSSQSTQTSTVEECDPPKLEADPLGVVYLLLALTGFGVAVYVLCLATPVLAAGAMLICLLFFAGSAQPRTRGESFK